MWLCSKSHSVVTLLHISHNCWFINMKLCMQCFYAIWDFLYLHKVFVCLSVCPLQHLEVVQFKWLSRFGLEIANTKHFGCMDKSKVYELVHKKYKKSKVDNRWNFSAFSSLSLFQIPNSRLAENDFSFHFTQSVSF